MKAIHFEARQLKSHAEPVSVSELEKGSVYFAVQYVDRAMLIPVVETLVFIGRNLDPGNAGRVCFQTIDSYRLGVRYDSANQEDLVSFRNQAEDQVMHIFDFEHALDELMKCSLRRGEAEQLV